MAASAGYVKQAYFVSLCPIEGRDGTRRRLGENVTAFAREKFRSFGGQAQIVVLAGPQDQQIAALLISTAS